MIFDRSKHIYLIGYRCCGKTSVGKKLSIELSLPFSDTDLLIEQDIHARISDFVKSKGWNAFRDVESKVLNRISKLPSQIVSTGGGIILSAENRMIFRKTGVCVWLDASNQIIFQRMTADPSTLSSRPELTSMGLHEEIKQTKKERDPIYQASADLKVDTSTQSISQIVQLLAKEYRHDRQ